MQRGFFFEIVSTLKKADKSAFFAFFRVFSRFDVDFWGKNSSKSMKLSRFDASLGRRLPIREERIEIGVDTAENEPSRFYKNLVVFL